MKVWHQLINFFLKGITKSDIFLEYDYFTWFSISKFHVLVSVNLKGVQCLPALVAWKLGTSGSVVVFITTITLTQARPKRLKKERYLQKKTIECWKNGYFHYHLIYFHRFHQHHNRGRSDVFVAFISWRINSQWAATTVDWFALWSICKCDLYFL